MHTATPNPRGKTVVLVRGIPGAGKTWLCEAVSSIPGAEGFDTDDFITRAYEAAPGEPEVVRGEAALMLDEAVDASTASVCVIVGVTLWSISYHAGDKGVLAFYIRLDPREFYAIYTRTLRRQVDAWKRAVIPAQLEGEELSWWITSHHLGAVDPTRSAEQYIAMYNSARDQDSKRGYHPAKQADLLKLITRLAKK